MKMKVGMQTEILTLARLMYIILDLCKTNFRIKKPTYLLYMCLSAKIILAVGKRQRRKYGKTFFFNVGTGRSKET